MKILFISKLMATAAAGPNWSVPARIAAQARIDDVYWINLDKSVMPHWIESGLYHSLDDLGGKLSLSSLPFDFKKPDFVVFEVPFFPQYLKFAKELRKNCIPYIIVPRCSFTRQALNNHSKWKKRIAGWLCFNKFFKGAKAIQYLTLNELNDSTPFICPNGFVIPNGISLPSKIARNNKGSKLKGVFIGRIDIYHKGLDLLLKAIITNASYLRQNNVTFDIYGPPNSDYDQLVTLARNNNVEDIFCLKGGVAGLEKEEVLKNADFFIMTSRFEGQPMALLEALSFGLPCIVTEGTYMRKEVELFNAGIGCETTESSIGSAIQKMVSQKDNLKKYQDNAYRLATKYQWTELAMKFHEKLLDYK